MVLTIPAYKPVSKVSDIPPGGIGNTSGGGIIRFDLRILTRYGVVVVDFGEFKDILSYRDSLSVEGASGNWTVRMRAILCNEELLKKIHPGMVVEIYCARNDDPLIGVNLDPSEIERIDTTPELPELAVVQPIAPATGGTATPSGPVNVQPSGGGVPSKDEAVRLILAECQKQGVTDPNQIAYILASAQHESDQFNTLEEYASGAAYNGRSDLGNTQPGDGERYKGRGYVQITGRNNYQKYSDILGIDLVGNPELAEDPAIAAFILVNGMKNGTFTGASLGEFIGGGNADFYSARRTVNGLDRAGLIAGYAEDWLGKLPQYQGATPATPVVSQSSPGVAQPVAPAASIATPDVIGPEVEPVDDPYLDKCPYLLIRGVVTDYGRSTSDAATSLVLSGDSYGKIYKEAFVLADLLAPELAATSLEVRNATRVPLGVSYIYYRLLKEWVEEFWGQTTGWEVRTRPIPFPPNYMTRINNEGSVWSNLEFLAIQGFFHIFIDHTGAIVWEKLPWSSREQSLITGRNWEDLPKMDLPSWKIVTWGDRLSEQGITNFIRCIPTQQGISGGNGSMGYRSLVYNMGSVRQYGGPTKRELMFPVGTSQDQYYTSEARKEQAATNVAFVDLCALESIRWYDRPVQRVTVQVRGEAAWRINTRVELAENWHCKNAKPAQYYVTSRTNQIDVLRSTWTTQLDLVRDRRKRYLGIGVGEVPIIEGNTEASENSEIESAIQSSGTLAPVEGIDLSFDALGEGLISNSEQTANPGLDLSFGTSDVSPSIFSDVGQGLTADNSAAPDLFGSVGSGLNPAESTTTETAIVTPPSAAPTVIEPGPTVADDEAYLQLPLVPDEYWFFNRFTGRVEPIGNDPIKWANENVIPKIGQAPVVTQVQPATTATGTIPAATGPAAPFTPVDNIYTDYLYDESPPGAWDFTIERGGNFVTPIPSAVSGTVTRSEWISGYGNAVEVTAPDGTVIFMAHMDSRAVQVGQTIQRGQTIGNQGTTGNSSGEHIHMEVGTTSERISPRSVSRPIVEEYFNFISGGKAKIVGGGF